MTWKDIGKDHLQAAKQALERHPRSAASRAYYAAHVVLAEELIAAGCVLGSRRETPPHNAQAQLIGMHLAGRGASFVRELRSVVRRLYSRRLDADYKRTVTLDRALALDSVRDASTLFSLFDVM